MRSDRGFAIPPGPEAAIRRRVAGRQQKRTRDGLAEAEFEQQLLAMSRLLGWMGHHTRDSRGVIMGDEGYPDWTFARGGCTIIAELKREDGRLGPQQEAWLHALGWMGEESQWLQTGPHRVYLWRPKRFSDIQHVFQTTEPDRGEPA